MHFHKIKQAEVVEMDSESWHSYPKLAKLPGYLILCTSGRYPYSFTVIISYQKYCKWGVVNMAQRITVHSVPQFSVMELTQNMAFIYTLLS